MLHQSRRLLFRFFLPYLAVLVVPTCASYIAYIEAFRSVSLGVSGTNRSLLERTVENVDRSVAEIDNLVFALASDPDISRFLQVTDFLDTQNYTFMRQLHRQLPPYQITHNLIFRYFLYFGKSDVIVSPETIAFRLSLFYRGSMAYESMTYDQWYQLLSGQYHDARVLPPDTVSMEEGQRRRLITYLQSIPIGYEGVSDGTVVVLLDERELERVLASLNIYGESWVALLDESFVPLAAVGAPAEEITEALKLSDTSKTAGGDTQELRFNGSQFQLMMMRSEHTGWTIAVGLPKSAIQSRVRRVQRIAYGGTVLSVLGGALLALMLAYSSSKPIRMVLRLLRAEPGWEPGEESGNDIDLSSLQPAVVRLISRNRHLRQEIHHQEPFVRDAIFERVLRGEQIEESELQSLIDLGSFDIRARHYLCLILHIRGFDGEMNQNRIRDLNIARVIIHDAIERFLGSTCYLHDIQMDKIVLLLHFDTEEEERCYELINRSCAALRKHLIAKYQFHCNIAGGRLVGDVGSVFVSYNEARQASSATRVESRDAVDYFAHTPSSNTRYHYPLETERALLGSLLAGNIDPAREKIREVHGSNFLQREIDGPTASNLFIELQGTILKLLDTEGVFTDRDARIVYGAAEELLLIEEIDAFFESLEGLAIIICRITSDRKRSHNSALLERAIAEIHGSFCDPNLTLGTLSREIGLSEVYLSQFFKEQMGENLSLYLTRMRVEKASELLHSELSMPIDEVASAVGYSSADTFRKAYKRIYGISPTRYRLASGKNITK
jgi:two-component system, response regulator YesN